MNIKHYAKLALFAAVMVMAATSCNEKKAEAPKAAEGPALETLKIRYIDEDSIMANYNLAKDINEAMLRRQNQYDAAQKQRGSDITKFGNAMQQKYQNNQYLTEEAFNADQAKLQKMQAPRTTSPTCSRASPMSSTRARFSCSTPSTTS